MQGQQGKSGGEGPGCVSCAHGIADRHPRGRGRWLSASRRRAPERQQGTVTLVRNTQEAVCQPSGTVCGERKTFGSRASCPIPTMPTFPRGRQVTRPLRAPVPHQLNGDTKPSLRPDALARGWDGAQEAGAFGRMGKCRSLHLAPSPRRVWGGGGGVSGHTEELSAANRTFRTCHQSPRTSPTRLASVSLPSPR